ncbi:cache domain-containing protein [Aliarcobacter skirrowii]|jgi:signal transduction histidine kinase|nr:cache domain-containing protein [Aliarcobacter skirrowii]
MKLSYIKIFEPFDWHIGTGEYLDEQKETTKSFV